MNIHIIICKVTSNGAEEGAAIFQKNEVFEYEKRLSGLGYLSKDDVKNY